VSDIDGTPERFADDARRFRLDGRIATGGMGEVWRGTDTVLGRKVAVKLLKAEYADDPTFRSRFETEARHAAALHHPGIAGVYDVGEGSPADGSVHPRPFLVMELVEGQPLSTLIAGGRELDPDAVRDLLSQVGDALGAAHAAGIVHRDVKPANLIVTPAGKIKVTDFGIARAADGVGITRTGAVMGTPQYLSPEQAEGRPATAASDVYALGVVAFEMLAGRRPFEADSPVATALAHVREPVPELPADVPRDLATVVRRSLAKDPAERFADGAAFADALRDPATAVTRMPPAVVPPLGEDSATQVLPAQSDATPPPVVPVPPVTPASPGPDPASQEKKRSPWPIVVVVVLVLALIGVVTALALSSGDDDSATDDTQSSSPSRTRSETPSETSEGPALVSLNEGDFLNRPVDEVESDLRNLGFDVERDEQSNADPGQNGLVTSVSPNGDVEEGSLITVGYNGNAPEETEEPPPPSETEEPSEPPTSSEPTLPTDPVDPSATTGAGVDDGGGPADPADEPAAQDPASTDGATP
jgi:eukaryotic-like serine/threonine-protein kinase